HLVHAVLASRAFGVGALSHRLVADVASPHRGNCRSRSSWSHQCHFHAADPAASRPATHLSTARDFGPANSVVKSRKTSVFTDLRPFGRSPILQAQSPSFCGKRCGNCKFFIPIGLRVPLETLDRAEIISL